ncbi:hypothetical protein GYMLUDRAFT_244145 [Collybiopsis luxurians FD-317 M1]|uniref:Uncharacterized protein n=1 Tax=Collybiopsis luxurians FD-317 M1 TaxID=944289 RepID=A0A0D0CDM3_9AGAR|nr:hypothetical protein GYMLUDRAFT_244145 [Collybiopsis luxurians FD-317 M1]
MAETLFLYICVGLGADLNDQEAKDINEENGKKPAASVHFNDDNDDGEEEDEEEGEDEDECKREREEDAAQKVTIFSSKMLPKF